MRHHIAPGLLLAACALLQVSSAAQSLTVGIQDAAWAPDGKRVAVSYLDRIWTMAPDGRQAKALSDDATAIEREPAWSPDGSRIAFATRRDEGFDIYVASLKGESPTAVTSMPGD